MVTRLVRHTAGAYHDIWGAAQVKKRTTGLTSGLTGGDCCAGTDPAPGSWLRTFTLRAPQAEDAAAVAALVEKHAEELTKVGPPTV